MAMIEKDLKSNKNIGWGGKQSSKCARKSTSLAGQRDITQD
jgi:hypothetical protein